MAARIQSRSIAARCRAYLEDRDLREGVRDMAPLLPGSAAWALVTGVAMVKVLGVPLALLMSLVVYSGGSQLAALPLLAAGAPLWVILFTGFVVNLRFIVYSVQWRWYFGHLGRTRRLCLGFFATDQAYALFAARYPDGRAAPDQLRRYVGATASMWLVWQSASILGIVFAERVPMHWGLGFVGVLALVGLTCSLVQDRVSLATAGIAGLAAIAAVGLPFKLNMVVAIAAAVAAGLMTETLWPARRQAMPPPGGPAP